MTSFIDIQAISILFNHGLKKVKSFCNQRISVDLFRPKNLQNPKFSAMNKIEILPEYCNLQGCSYGGARSAEPNCNRSRLQYEAIPQAPCPERCRLF